jgi:hypothetical protein
MTRLVLAVLLVAVGVVAMPSHMLAHARTANRPTWTTGNTWSYQEGDETATWTVLGATQDGYLVGLTTAPPVRTYTYRFDRDLIFSQALYFHPKWPLTPGDKWSYTASGPAYNGIGGTNVWVTRVTAVGWESVTVPAGRFIAFRIHGQQCDVTQNACGDFDVWYSPQAKYTVKISYSAAPYWSHDIRGLSRVLTSYKVAP